MPLMLPFRVMGGIRVRWPWRLYGKWIAMPWITNADVSVRDRLEIFWYTFSPAVRWRIWKPTCRFIYRALPHRLALLDLEPDAPP